MKLNAPRRKPAYQASLMSDAWSPRKALRIVETQIMPQVFAETVTVFWRDVRRHLLQSLMNDPELQDAYTREMRDQCNQLMQRILTSYQIPYTLNAEGQAVVSPESFLPKIRAAQQNN